MCKEWTDAVSISCGAWSAKILPAFGMNVISLTRNEREILRNPPDFQTLRNNPYVYGIPLLLPANRTKGGAFEFMGNSYTLPVNEPARGNHIHGLMYNAPFEVVSKDVKSLKAVYENRGERYPFPFTMTITDILSEAGLTRTVSIENTAGQAFPYTLAFHTSFKEPDCLKVLVRDRFLCDENYIPTRKRAALTETEKRYCEGVSLKNRALSGFYASDGAIACLDAIRFSVSENFDEWILFNAGGGRGFVCVEPQAGEVNGLNTKDGSRIIEKGDKHTFTLSITQEEKA